MPQFDRQFVLQVLDATDIVELVSRYVALNKKGREFVGLCPFHADKTPSMYVSPTKQIFKCFACGAGGDAIKFITLYEKMTFPEAVRNLAEQAGIPLPKEVAPAPAAPPGMSKNDLSAVVATASTYYQKQLQSPAGAAALDYARSRGLTDESIQRFGLGYAPDAWDSLYAAARKAGHADEQLVAAGLCKRRQNGPGCYDVFRNRLLFPIHDLSGRAVGFGGRALAADEQAKYLNSPESALFDKSGLLYGMQFARESIVQKKQAVVVEGYLDVLLPIQAGVENLVATLGTSLTERHARLLSRYAEEAVLIFDADVAGQAAAERALQIFLSQRLHVRVASIPAGKDPADYVLAEGPEALQTLIDEAPDALEYVWAQRYKAFQAAGGNPARRSGVVEDFLQLVVNSAAWGAIDGPRQQMLAQHIAHILNIPAIDLQQQMRGMARKLRPRGQGVPTDDQPPADAGAVPIGAIAGAHPAERQIIEVLLNAPELFDDVMEKIFPEDFNDALLRTLAQAVWAAGEEGRLSLQELLSREELASLAGLMTQLAFDGERRANHGKGAPYETTLHDAIDILRQRAEHKATQQLRSGPLDDDALRALQDRLKSQHRNPRRRPRIQ